MILGEPLPYYSDVVMALVLAVEEGSGYCLKAFLLSLNEGVFEACAVTEETAVFSFFQRAEQEGL